MMLNKTIEATKYATAGRLGSGHKFEIIATIDTRRLEYSYLNRLVDNGATILRINGSFLRPEDLESIVNEIREYTGKKNRILLDLPGYKLRFLYLEEEIDFKKNTPFFLKKNIFNYPDFINRLKKGEVIRLNDGMDELIVLDIMNDGIKCVSGKDGKIRRGKGLHPENPDYRPGSNSLSQVDHQLIEKAMLSGIEYLGLSYIHNREDILYVKGLLKGSVTDIIPKIESKPSMENLSEILACSEIVIVDRGDLSGEAGLENISELQRRILMTARFFRTRVIFATQFMSHMLHSPLPSVAEVDSLYTLLKEGIDGIQFSDETCVGSYGSDAVLFTSQCVKKFYARPEAADSGWVIWILGPSASGKTTIAKILEEQLKERKIPVIHYDGDEVRDMFGPGLGFAPENRLQVVKTLTHFAEKNAKAGSHVIVSALTANDDARKWVAESVDNLVTVYLECETEECIRRDPKGLYKKAVSGEIDTMVGYNSPYIVPENSDLVIDTGQISPLMSSEIISRYLVENNKI